MHNGTIEEEVLSLHEEKRQLAASVLDGADVAARLDGDELLDRAETRHSQRDTLGLLRLKFDTSIPMKNAWSKKTREHQLRKDGYLSVCG